MLSSNHFDKTYFSSDKVNSVIIKENEFSLSIEVLALLDTLEYLRRSGRITELLQFRLLTSQKTHKKLLLF